jgi:hypothetical protein
MSNAKYPIPNIQVAAEASSRRILIASLFIHPPDN